MSAEATAEVRTWRVGKRRVTVTVPRVRTGQVLHTAFEWSPNLPRRLSRREWKQCRAGRDAAFAELFAELGIRGVVLEV